MVAKYKNNAENVAVPSRIKIVDRAVRKNKKRIQDVAYFGRSGDDICIDNHLMHYFGLGDIDLLRIAVTEGQIEEFNLLALPNSEAKAIRPYYYVRKKDSRI